MADKTGISRRDTLQGLGAFGTAAVLGSADGAPRRHPRKRPSTLPGMDASIGPSSKKVFETPLIDTHEHLIEEKERLAGPRTRASRRTTGACC